MSSISSDLLRGNTDTILLRFLNEGDSYGYEINRKVRQLTDGVFEFSEATLYSAFRRLEKDGCIRSYWGEGDSGARRRYYAIEQKGRDLYARNVEDWNASKQMLERLIQNHE